MDEVTAEGEGFLMVERMEMLMRRGRRGASWRSVKQRSEKETKLLWRNSLWRKSSFVNCDSPCGFRVGLALFHRPAELRSLREAD